MYDSYRGKTLLSMLYVYVSKKSETTKRVDKVKWIDRMTIV